MNKIIDLIKDNDKFKNIINLCDKKNSKINITGLADSAKAFMITSISDTLDKSSVIICSNNMEAKKVISDLEFFTDKKVLYFPSRDIVYYNVDAENRDNQNLRMEVINHIKNGDNACYIVTTIDAVTQPMLAKDVYSADNLSFKVGEDININEVMSSLIKLGYERYPNVEGKGQFSVRGGILDVYGISNDYPCRIELFGDTIDTIRSFDTISQRSITNIDNYDLVFANEFNISEEVVNETKIKLEELIDKNDLTDELKKVIKSDIDKLELRQEISLLDKYFKLFFNNTTSFLDYVKDYNIYISEISRCKEKIQGLIYESNETLNILSDKNHIYLPYATEIYTYEYIEQILKKSVCITLNAIDYENDSDYTKIELHSTERNFYKNNIELLLRDLEKKDNNTYTMLVFNTDIRKEQMTNILGEYKFKNIVVENIYSDIKYDIQNIHITKGILAAGFKITDLGIDIICEPVSGVLNKTKKMTKSNEFAGSKINSFEDLNVGDYVVHEAYGIGIYKGIENVAVERVIKDYIKLEYDKSSNIFVPIDNIDSIKKYICDDEVIPKLNSIGSKEWSKTRAKAKAHVEEIAKELVLLYAKRNEQRGYAFSEDTVFQKEFEDTFKYDLTVDQEKSIKEIKEDMQDIKPMDRLLCGDVGYGKTEVAIRAAFKAVMDNKQVAYMVPTTVLSLQQYNSFKARMENFGIKVEMLSRFRSLARQKSVIKGLKEGKIDIVIGTHRLISKDVEFKDLGLLIIDEEHKFGVKAKEAIKEYKAMVDVLSMTATPIPRTLHMSMIGIRGISTITTPPLERMPVHTYVTAYDEMLIKNAIYKELARDGQVFYVSNRVDNIEEIANKVRILVPEARVDYAHGQMQPKEIEDVMMDFMEHKTDVIVCTTILESGIDIPNANTIIVENADRLGLASLYQIRGRVGRSSRLAYAYVTYDKQKQVNEVASKRLKAIKDFTEFGSGHKIAMRDLEIRGAGNLLGKAQSGHMAAIGYDLYLSMLERAIKKEQSGDVNEFEEIIKEVKINVNVSAYIPDSYIKDPAIKVAMYHKISEAHTKEEVLEVVDELLDRFSDMPKVVDNLIKVVEIRNLCRKLDILKVNVIDNTVIFESDKAKEKLRHRLSSKDVLLDIQYYLKQLENKDSNK